MSRILFTIKKPKEICFDCAYAMVYIKQSYLHAVYKNCNKHNKKVKNDRPACNDFERIMVDTSY